MFDVIAENDRIAGPFIAAQGQTVFPFDFPVAADPEISVTRKRDGVSAVLLLATDYSVGRNQNGGTITLAAPSLSMDEITITGVKPVERDRAFKAGVHFEAAAADALNNEFAALVMMLQELRRDLAAAGGGGGGGVSLTPEQVQDICAQMIRAGAGVTVTYNDLSNELVIAATAGGGGGLTEEQVQDVVAGMLAPGSNIVLTYDDAANRLTIAAGTGGPGGGLSLEEIQDAIAGFIQVGPGITKTYDDVANTLTLATDTIAGGADAEVIRDVIGQTLEAPDAGIEIEVDDPGNKLRVRARGKNTSPGLNAADLVAAPLIARFWGQVIIPIDYGLTGDWQEDATVKFQKAVDQLAGSDCEGIVTPGTFSVDRVTWPGEARVVLKGRAGGPSALNGASPGSGQYVGAEIRARTAGQPAMIFGDANPATTDFRKAGHLLRDLQFVGNGNAAPLVCYNQISMQVEDCNFLTTAANAPSLEIFGAVQCNFERSIFRNGPAVVRPFFNPGDGGVMSSTTIVFLGCLFISCTRWGLMLIDSRGVTVSQCVIEGCGIAGDTQSGGIYSEYLERVPSSNHGNYDNPRAPTLILEDAWFEANRGGACVRNNGGLMQARHCHFIANPLADRDYHIMAGGYAIRASYHRTEIAGRHELYEDGPGAVWNAAANPNIHGPNVFELLRNAPSSAIPNPKAPLIYLDPRKSEVSGMWQTYPVGFGTVNTPLLMMPPGAGGSARGEWRRDGDDVEVRIYYRFGGAGQVFANDGSQWAFTLPARAYSDPAAFQANTPQVWTGDGTNRRYGRVVGIVSPQSLQLRLFQRDANNIITHVTIGDHLQGIAAASGQEIVVTARYPALFA